MFNLAESSAGSSETVRVPDASTPETQDTTDGSLASTDSMQDGDSLTHQDRVELLTTLDKNLTGVLPEAGNRRTVLKQIAATLAGLTRFSRFTMQGIALAEAANASKLAVESSDEAA